MEDPRLKQPKNDFQVFMFIILLLGTLLGGYLLLLDAFYTKFTEHYRIVFKIPEKKDYMIWFLILGLLDTLLGNAFYPSSIRSERSHSMYYIYRPFRILFFPKRIYLNENYRFTILSKVDAPVFLDHEKEEIRRMYKSGKI
jgi:hypothetical protein